MKSLARLLVPAVSATFLLFVNPVSVHAQSGVAGWGDHVFDSRWNGASFAHLFVGPSQTIGVTTNGEIASMGQNANG